ncbi:hypothetical protein [Roseibacillus persicicus]|uniref:hypothetical protein n=1 Tax=Roseibacillus persicicus TaxID=454148 RepID=UPI00280FBF70|nr:hypothetical protein [Roseibacillus persicicus]MDQ8192476.1 hypothetical protein [Roseibacillus persicicus]
MRKRSQLRRFVLVTALLAGSCLGGGVNWGNELGSSAVSSQGVPLDSSWTFFLGYFEGGFTPTASNSEQWASQWRTLDASGYSTSSGLFGSAWDHDGVSSGRKGYIWGLNRSSPANEWVLYTAASWVVPINNPLNPNSNWFTADADTFVVGSLVGSQLQTASEEGEPPVLRGEEWLEIHFDDSQRADPAISGWDADPDSDNLSNLEEFAFGADPLASDTVCVEVESVEGFLQFRCLRARAVAVLYHGQVSSDLVAWDEGGSFVTLESASPDALVYRDLTPITSANPARFGRVRVELQP